MADSRTRCTGEISLSDDCEVCLQNAPADATFIYAVAGPPPRSSEICRGDCAKVDITGKACMQVREFSQVQKGIIEISRYFRDIASDD